MIPGIAEIVGAPAGFKREKAKMSTLLRYFQILSD